MWLSQLFCLYVLLLGAVHAGRSRLFLNFDESGISHLLRSWKSISALDLSQRSHTGTHATKDLLGSYYASYLAMIGHFDLALAKIEQDPTVEGPDEKTLRRDLGSALVGLFDLLEQFPDVTKYKETKAHVRELDTGKKGTYRVKGDRSAVELGGIYNEKSLLEIVTKASDLGNSKAQHILASAYATGVLNGEIGLVPMDAGRSLMLHWMSALSGHPEANVAMGYRFANGIGVKQSCTKALKHYEYAANVAMNQIRERGYPYHVEKAYLKDEDNAAKPLSSDNDPEVVQYLKQLVEEGDLQASINLGKMYLHGNKLLDQNLETAAKFFKLAAKAGSPSASGMLGYILAQRLGGSVNSEYSDEEIAEMLLSSSARGDPHGVQGYGYVNFHGIGVERNHTKAFNLFHKASTKHPDAPFWMGEMQSGSGGILLDGEKAEQARREMKEATTRGFAAPEINPAMVLHALEDANSVHTSRLELPPHVNEVGVDELAEMLAQAVALRKGYIYKQEPDYATALVSYTIGAQRGHVGALHRLSHMAKAGLGSGGSSCSRAMMGFRQVAEAGDWARDLTLAHRMYSLGALREKRDSLRLFTRLAVMGYETAQYNAAHLLSRRVQPQWYNYRGSWGGDSQSRAREGTGKEKQEPSRFVDAPLSFSWLPWVQWRFALYGIPEPTSRLLHKQDDYSDTLILHENEEAEELKLSIGLGEPSSERLNREKEKEDEEEEEEGDEDPLSQMTRVLRSAGNTVRDSEARALSMYALSASQGNADAHLRLGDFHYYGMGWLEVDKKEAARFYQHAADLHHTHAIFNLGVMHEAGDGVEQDFHLAKRFYDQAAEYNSEARVPRVVALFVLRWHQTIREVGAMYPSVASSVDWIVKKVVDFRTALNELVRGRLKDAKAIAKKLAREQGDMVGELTGLVGVQPFGASQRPPLEFVPKPVNEVREKSSHQRHNSALEVFGIIYGRMRNRQPSEKARAKKIRKERHRAQFESHRLGYEKFKEDAQKRTAQGASVFGLAEILLIDASWAVCGAYLSVSSFLENLWGDLLRDQLLHGGFVKSLLYPWRFTAQLTIAAVANFLVWLLPALDFRLPWVIPEMALDACTLIYMVFLYKGCIAFRDFTIEEVVPEEETPQGQRVDRQRQQAAIRERMIQQGQNLAANN